MISVVVGWHVYELTDSALHLGLIGLAQFMAPVLFMFRPDRSSIATIAASCCAAVTRSRSYRQPG